jgi:hypothetical protein
MRCVVDVVVAPRASVVPVMRCVVDVVVVPRVRCVVLVADAVPVATTGCDLRRLLSRD